MLLGKSVGILSSPLLEQSTVTPSEVSVQLHTLGHDNATPTSKITKTITVLRNCILRRQSTNIKYIYLIMSNFVMHVYRKCMQKFIIRLFQYRLKYVPYQSGTSLSA